MFTDENSDKEIECDLLEDDLDVIKKSLSTVGFVNTENHNAKPLTLRSTQSCTGAEDLRLCSNFQRINLCNRMNVVPTPKRATVCPCGCLLRPATAGPLRTREKNSLALYVVSPEVLNYHGYYFEPSQIAMFWKKDCRMFLWKGKAKTSGEKKDTYSDPYKA